MMGFSRGQEPARLRDRFTPVFAVTFAVVTLADISTTYLCVHRLDLGELNPFTDTSSFWGLLWPELIAWVVGICAVRLGYVILRRQRWVSNAPGLGFAEFRQKLLSIRGLPLAVLLVVPFALTLGRLVPVASNLGLLFLDINPYDTVIQWISERLELADYRAYVLTQVASLTVWTFVALPVVYRLAIGKCFKRSA